MVTGKCDRLSSAAGRNVAPLAVELAAADQPAGREVLVDQQRVEHLADAGQRAQLGVAQVAVVAQLRGLALQRKALRADGVRRDRAAPAAARC